MTAVGSDGWDLIEAAQASDPEAFGRLYSSVLHRIAELLVGFDWSSPQLEDYATGYATPVGTAYHQACQEHLTPRDLARWDLAGGGQR
jgi:hypothetical protein